MSDRDSKRRRSVPAADDPTIDVDPGATQRVSEAPTTPGGAPSGSTDRTPRRIGPYPVLKRIGAGGMGEVYLAEDPRLRRRIAIKVLPPRAHGARLEIARFEREARLLAALNHPNIATIHSLESTGSVHFLTMELVPGRTLATRIAEGPLSRLEFLRVARQITQAVEAAHKRGVVHLDLKPANIMLTPDEHVKVLDFGLARMLSGDGIAAGDGALPDERSSGTPGYMSPEQIRGDDVDHRADIWALGCVLFECLSGRPAWPGSSVRERFRATLEGEVAWSDLPVSVPPWLTGLIRRYLTRDAARRPDSVEPGRRQIEDALALEIVRAPSTRAFPIEVGYPNNLPRHLTSFVGRERERDELGRLLIENRLVTLTGMGGCGKTRLSLEVAIERLPALPCGVWVVELAPVSDPSLVTRTVASALGLRDEPGRAPLETLIDHLRERAPLLILDNCENLVDTCASLVDQLLVRCPQLRVLATSRERLGITGEVVYHLPPMATVGDEEMPLDELRRVEAVRLFAERAAAISPGFELSEANAPAVRRICRQLEGIPLAVELAAARVAALSVEEIAGRLDDRFRILGTTHRGGLPHHRTLQALIDWSYDHLSENEQTFFRRLSVFAGGWTLEGAEEVTTGDGIEVWDVLDLITHLVDKSLVERDVERSQGTGRTRYRMLETVRQYGSDRLLERGEMPALRQRHLGYMVSLAEAAEPQLIGPEQVTWLSHLEAEHGNLRAAARTCREAVVDAEMPLRLAGALGRFWQIRGHWREGRRFAADVLARPDTGADPGPRAKVLNWAGILARVAGDYGESRALLEECLRLRREIGDRAGTAAALNNLALVALRQGDPTEAGARLEESLAIRRDLGDRAGTAGALLNLGLVTMTQADHVRARAIFEESLDMLRDLGDRRGIALALQNLGIVAKEDGAYRDARKHFAGSLEIKRELGDRSGAAASLTGLGVVAEKLGEYAEAAAFHAESLGIQRAMKDRHGMTMSLHNLGQLAIRRGELERARDLHRESLDVAREIDNREAMVSAYLGLGTVALRSGELEEAGTQLRRSLEMCRDRDDPAIRARPLLALGRLAMKREDWLGAARILGAVVALSERLRLSRIEVDDIEETVAELRGALGDAFEERWAEGRALPLEDAIEFALMEPGDELP